MIDPLTSVAFSIFENRGVFALLLGSGISRSAQIPTGWEIVLELTRRIAALEGVDKSTDWLAWYRAKFGKEANYSELLDALAHLPEERRSIIHKFIEPTPKDIDEGRKIPTRAHRAIAKLVRDGYFRTIITTNFDRLLENAIRDEGVEPTVIKSDDDLKGAVPLMHTRCCIVKVHGDYLDTRIRNTQGELDSYSSEMNAFLDRIIDEHGLLVCGWSADWDGALRAAIARAPNRRYSFFWASRSEPSIAAKDLIESRRGLLISIKDADTFFESIQRRIEIQETLQSTNPSSIELLVAAAKKYLSKSEYRIQLHELVMGEVRLVQKNLADESLGTQGPWSKEEFCRRVARYEEISEPLVKVSAAIGRWGDGSELPLLADILSELGTKRVVGGVNHWRMLRTYPAVLVMYAFGIGALSASRFDVLLQWLLTPVYLENECTNKPAVQSLFLFAWDDDGTQKAVWRLLEGLEHHYIPLSEHLYQVFDQLLGEYAVSKSAFELLFERFELLASLAHTTSYADRAELAERVAVNNPNSLVFVPFGRSAWQSQNQRVLAEEFGRIDVQQKLLSAGFAQGQQDFLDLALRNLTRAMGHVRRL
jgi:hypothetical protein